MQSLPSPAINTNSQCTAGRWNENTLFVKVGGGGGGGGSSWCGTLRVFYQADGEVTWWHLSGGKNLISPPGSNTFTCTLTVDTLVQSHTLLHGHIALAHTHLDQALKNRTNPRALEYLPLHVMLNFTRDIITVRQEVISDIICNPCNVWFQDTKSFDYVNLFKSLMINPSLCLFRKACLGSFVKFWLNLKWLQSIASSYSKDYCCAFDPELNLKDNL